MAPAPPRVNRRATARVAGGVYSAAQTMVVTRILACAVIVAWATLFAGCERTRGNNDDPPAAPQQQPQMPQPAVQPPGWTPVAPTAPVLQQPPQAPAGDPRISWDEQRIARLEQQVSAVSLDNQTLRQQLAQTQADLRATQEQVRGMQNQARNVRRAVQGWQGR